MLAQSIVVHLNFSFYSAPSNESQWAKCQWHLSFQHICIIKSGVWRIHHAKDAKNISLYRSKWSWKIANKLILACRNLCLLLLTILGDSISQIGCSTLWHPYTTRCHFINGCVPMWCFFLFSVYEWNESIVSVTSLKSKSAMFNKQRSDMIWPNKDESDGVSLILTNMSPLMSGFLRKVLDVSFIILLHPQN